VRQLFKRLRCENGQALVELAFVIPIVLLFLFGIIDFGLALNKQNEATNIANIAVREAAIIGTMPTATCTLNGTSNTYYDLADWTNCESQATGGPVLSAVCVYDTASSPPGAIYASGDPVLVKVSTSFGWMKLLSGESGGLVTSIGANATMREEGTISSGASTPFLANAATTWPSLTANC
jgi:Flp pilus assembly protein TadG